MTNEEFKNWIKGYITLTSDNFFNKKQYIIVKNHANLVFATVNRFDSDIKKFLFELKKNFRE